MKRELMSAGLATAVLVGGLFVGSAAVAQTVGKGAAPQSASTGGKVKNPDSVQERVDGFAPQGIVEDGAMARISGENRYETAALVAEAYGWSWDNTGVVFIASGANYPDALAVGPSVAGVGPLLLVRPTEIHPATKAALEELQPCFIHVIGGTSAVSNTVYKQLRTFTHPELCEEAR